MTTPSIRDEPTGRMTRRPVMTEGISVVAETRDPCSKDADSRARQRKGARMEIAYTMAAIMRSHS